MKMNHRVHLFRYGDDDGLEFTVLNETLGDAAKAVASVWKQYGPVLQLAAATVTTAVAMTSGIQLGEILPDSVVEVAQGYATAKEFVREYCASLATLVESDEGPWRAVEPSAGRVGLRSAFSCCPA